MLIALREISDARSTKSVRDQTPRPPSPPIEPKTVVDELVVPAPTPKIIRPDSPASSTHSFSVHESASGAETEEDEGMVLVGRPPV
jgi:hypothetical protein